VTYNVSSGTLNHAMAAAIDCLSDAKVNARFLISVCGNLIHLMWTVCHTFKSV